MTGEPRIAALLDAVDYLVRRGVPGAFVECGVWRGGSILAMILKLQQLGAAPRDIYLYDTFEGMTTPTELDTSAYSEPAIRTWQRAVAAGERPWGHLLTPEQFNEANVRSLLESTGYPTESLHFVRGPVEETLPDHAPERISLLRLDTDWYESTRHELVHLFPRLQPGGVLIVDDYGHWEGCRRAVDEYFTSQATPLFLSRVDYAARIGVKVL